MQTSHEPIRIVGPLQRESLASLIADAGWTVSDDGAVVLFSIADREEVFGSIRPLVQQDAAVVAIGPPGDVACAVSALRAGAQEYLEENATDEAIVAAVERVMARRRRGDGNGVPPPGGDRPRGRHASWLEALFSGGAVGLRNTPTGAFSLAYLREQHRRETWRCRRSGQPFSLAVVTADATEDPVAFAATVEDVAREVDVVAEIGEREWVVLLPETDRLGAALFRRRLWRSLSLGGHGTSLPVRKPSSIGIASHLGEGEGEGEGLEASIARAREDALAFGASSAERFRHLDFWSTVSALLSRGFLADRREGAAVFREIWREAARDRTHRKLLYLGGDALPPGGPRLAGGSRLHLLGSGSVDLPGGVIAVAADPRMGQHQIALYLGERQAYAFLRQAEGTGRTPAFHTSDPALVDHLIDTLHGTYDLPA